MTTPHLPKVAGINPPLPAPSHTPPSPGSASPTDPTGPSSPTGTGATDTSGLPGSADARRARPTGPTGLSLPVPNALVQDRLAGWISALTTVQELTERLARTATLDAALHEVLRAGASLVGARRGLVTLHPARGPGHEHPTTVGFGLDRADLGHIETIPRGPEPAGTPGRRAPHGPPEPPRPFRAYEPRETPGPPEPTDAHGSRRSYGRDAAPGAAERHGSGAPYDSGETFGSGTFGPYGRLFDDLPPVGTRTGTAHPDIAADEELAPRHREVAARLGYGASYAVPLESEGAGRLGAAIWLYDEPAEPTERQRHLVGLYRDYATEHLARQLELAEARSAVATLREELLPSRLPRIAGVRLAVHHHGARQGGGGWYDALPLPEGALGLAVGGVTGSGPSAIAAMGRLRASLRAYAVMEGEDPVAVLSDLELLLRLTEPARAATALFAYCEPAGALRAAGRTNKVVLAGAGHCPPLIIGRQRIEYVETSLSAPLGMLACWEAPSVEIAPAPGETLLFYSDGLLHRTGDAMDRAFARLHRAAASVPRGSLDDPDALVEHILRTVLPDAPEGIDGDGDDVILLAAHFA
ncbi:PP2C family protein-serine/threonine phosphatase [Streptomyces sp. ISL-11]|uniref:PP2C family protein-serine/threonine phosphatase n=1 Tax=Streptomyces sp. ISL-11 TaxID=2819174 RepID=UPI001BE8BF4A|nr:SpoIIE family protein phosphatase [Streptomyces sp. ISL-11]MBT2382860.1 SpoIIE family protein phosphatase [Streptomyces sp. ISL-11]